jgi:hypothetical protein
MPSMTKSQRELCFSAVSYKFGDIFCPTPTLVLPLKGRGKTNSLPLKTRGITQFLHLQGGGQEGGGSSVGVIQGRHRIYEKNHLVSAELRHFRRDKDGFANA